MLAFLMAAILGFQSSDILIFGGDGHRIYLGCLSCPKADKDSVSNPYSDQGWENRAGLWTEHGDYRSRYSERSACNTSASNPPILRERGGRAIGALTLNKYHRDSICGSGGDTRICEQLSAMCGAD